MSGASFNSSDDANRSGQWKRGISDEVSDLFEVDVTARADLSELTRPCCTAILPRACDMACSSRGQDASTWGEAPAHGDWPQTKAVRADLTTLRARCRGLRSVAVVATRARANHLTHAKWGRVYITTPRGRRT